MKWSAWIASHHPICTNTHHDWNAKKPTVISYRSLQTIWFTCFLALLAVGPPVSEWVQTAVCDARISCSFCLSAMYNLARLEVQHVSQKGKPYVSAPVPSLLVRCSTAFDLNGQDSCGCFGKLRATLNTYKCNSCQRCVPKSDLPWFSCWFFRCLQSVISKKPTATAVVLKFHRGEVVALRPWFSGGATLVLVTSIRSVRSKREMLKYHDAQSCPLQASLTPRRSLHVLFNGLVHWQQARPNIETCQ